MPDNIDVAPSEEATAVSVSTDEIGGVHYPIFKMSYGALGGQTPVSSAAPLPVKTVQSNGVPDSFTKETGNTGEASISKGNLNKIGFIPRILNEQVESSREVQGVVTSSNIVGQVFQASKDNISALMLTLESAAGILLDNFESYANSSELQVEWVESGIVLATLETLIVKTGEKSMSLPCGTAAHEWINTIPSTDYVDFTGSFDAYFSKEYNKCKVSVFIGDGTNTKSTQLIHSAKDIWESYEVNENIMIEDGGGTTNVSAITVVGFRIDDAENNQVCIIDNLIATPPPNDIRIKLWDMGETIPEIGATAINSGDQYEQIGAALASSFDLPLKGGKRLYHIHMFTAGTNKAIPSNETLNAGHYYIIQLEYIDTEVNVYGVDTSFGVKHYTNGFAFIAPDESTAISAPTEPSNNAYSDIMFGIFSSQDVYYTSIAWRFDAEPNGDSGIHVFIEDKNMKITDMVVDHEVKPEQNFTTDLSLRPYYAEDGTKLEFYYNDDHSDQVSSVIGEVRFLYEPPMANG